MLLVAALLGPRLDAQSRAAEIEAARDRKSASLTPEATPARESFFERLFPREKIARALGQVDGLSWRFGGLVTGSGFAFGPEYEEHNAARTMRFRGEGRASIRSFYRLNAGFDHLHLFGGRAFASVDANRRYLPRMDYYGPGPESEITGRSSYLLEDTSLDASFGVRLLRPLQLGITAGGLQTNAGPGRDPRFISTDVQFPDATTAGIAGQPHYLRLGAFIGWDTRNVAGNPRRGGNYSARWDQYKDVRLSRYSFRRLDFDAQQYVPFFNDRRVFVLRGQMVLSNANDGSRIPFFLQPTYGGSETGRGFRRFRFYGDNLLAFTAEYRWEVFSGLDMAVFSDAGKVFVRSRNIDLRELESCVGIGLRVNTRHRVLFRLDTGFSHEGVQVWVKFNNVF